MLFWTEDLKRFGFRKKNQRYWRCEKGFGLDPTSHLSIFLDQPHFKISREVACYEVAEFHVTFEVPGHNLHFYFHEFLNNQWAAAGHTSSFEIAGLGWNVAKLRKQSDEIATRFIQAFHGILRVRLPEL